MQGDIATEIVKKINDNLKQSKKAIASILESFRSKKGIKRDDVARVLHLSADSDEFGKIFEKNLKNAGCEYVFLFAADLTPYEELVQYYSDQLKFEKADEHCAAIPMYDFTCQFMSQKITGIPATTSTMVCSQYDVHISLQLSSQFLPLFSI